MNEEQILEKIRRWKLEYPNEEIHLVRYEIIGDNSTDDYAVDLNDSVCIYSPSKTEGNNN